MGATDGTFLHGGGTEAHRDVTETELGHRRRQRSPKPSHAVSPPGATHVSEVGCSPGLGHGRHGPHHLPIGPSEVVGRVTVVVPADPAEPLAQVLGRRHRHLPGGAEADDEFGFLGEPDGFPGLSDGQRAGDLHREGGWDPVDLEKTPVAQNGVKSLRFRDGETAGIAPGWGGDGGEG